MSANKIIQAIEDVERTLIMFDYYCSYSCLRISSPNTRMIFILPISSVKYCTCNYDPMRYLLKHGVYYMTTTSESSKIGCSLDFENKFKSLKCWFLSVPLA